MRTSNEARRTILELAHKAGAKGAHIAPSLSMVEICRSILLKTMDKNKDTFILSKGHAGLGYYVIMEQAGIITKEQLYTFETDGGDFPGQPSKSNSNGIVYSSGSLGMGLSYGLGCALAKKQNEGKVFVLLGDGECNEGSVWEAAMLAAQHKTTNLIAVVDKNGMQSDGFSKDIVDYNVVAIWESFGWDVVECDGHSEEELINALGFKNDKPLAIIAHTVKGKGVSFMENNRSWHHSTLTEKDYLRALEELVD